MQTTKTKREDAVIFLDWLRRRFPTFRDSKALQDKGKALLRFSERIKGALEGAGYPEGVMHRDERFAKPGFVMQPITPDPFGRWGIVVIRYDVETADFMSWMATYSRILRQAGIFHNVNPVRDLPPHGIAWGEIHIWMPQREVES